MKVSKELIIAAAGSGKTRELINRIVNATYLCKDKLIVVITYTNAASEEIIERLQKVISIPGNVFIGTIHSFLLTYLLKPYAETMGFVQDDIMINNIEIKQKSNEEKSKYMVRKNILIKALSEKGILTYDYIITLSKKLLKEYIVKERFCNRIGYIFLDEFQDTSNSQFEIIETIRRSKKSNIILVGDPEQKIMSFQDKSKKKDKNGNIKIHPIVSLQDKSTYKIIKKDENYRSSETIVDFINNFHSSIHQKYRCYDIKSKNEILFINKNDISGIVNKFNELCLDENYCLNKPKKRFFLSYENNTFDELNMGSNYGDSDYSKYLLLTMNLILKIYNYKKKEFLELYGITVVDFREVAIKLLNKFIKNINEKSKWEEYIEYYFGDIESNSREENFDDVNRIKIIDDYYKKLHELLKVDINNPNSEENDLCMTIHKSKGLQADAVLVLAKDINELSKWLECDPEKRLEDTTDTCRLGYVAFSRAREFLCIACMESIDEEIKSKLKSLKVTIV